MEDFFLLGCCCVNCELSGFIKICTQPLHFYIEDRYFGVLAGLRNMYIGQQLDEMICCRNNSIVNFLSHLTSTDSFFFHFVLMMAS